MALSEACARTDRCLTSMLSRIFQPASGYFELFGVEDGVKAQLYKLASISLCSNTAGQVSWAQMDVCMRCMGEPTGGE